MIQRGGTYRQRMVLYVLLVMLVGIWSRVIYSLYEQVESEEVLIENHAPFLHQAKTLKAGSLRGDYMADFKDPFEPATALFYTRIPKPAPIPKKNDAAASDIPQLTLQGITGVTATLNGADHEIHFVKPGDSLGEVKILEVTQDHVLASIKNTTFTLKLSP